MHEPPARQCASCYHARQIANRLRCVRNPPMPDPATAHARWPIVEPTDHCGRFRDNANQKSNIKLPEKVPDTFDSPLIPQGMDRQEQGAGFMFWVGIVIPLPV